jgi:hypothetical protein
MGLRANVLDAMLVAINATNETGTPFTRKQLIKVITTASAQEVADSWTIVSSTARSRRWKRINGDAKWYVAEANGYMFELQINGATAFLNVYKSPTVQPDDPQFPLDGAAYQQSWRITDDVSTNALAWACITDRIAAGTP